MDDPLGVCPHGTYFIATNCVVASQRRYNMSYYIPTPKFKVNKQESFEFALYEAFSECFDRVTISNNSIISSMRINYLETSDKLQSMMESLCAEEAKRLESAIPHTFRKKAKVSIIRSEDYYTEIRFTNDKLVVRITGAFNYSNSQVRINISNLETP